MIAINHYIKSKYLDNNYQFDIITIIGQINSTPKIEYMDERLTTMGASRFLNTTNTRGKKRKGVIDTVSACLIPESWLSKNKS